MFVSELEEDKVYLALPPPCPPIHKGGKGVEFLKFSKTGEEEGADFSHENGGLVK